MAGPEATPPSNPWLLRGRVGYLPTIQGIGTELAVVTPWTQWDLDQGGRWRFDLFPAVQLLWRGGEPQSLFSGGGVGGRLTQENLCVGDACFLRSLSVSAGYGGGTGAWEKGALFGGSLGLFEYRFGVPERGSIGATGGLTYLNEPLPSVGADFSVPINPSIPPLQADPGTLDPRDYFEPVGPFRPGRVTYLYYAIELQDAEGRPLHPPIPMEDRRRLIEFDRQFAFAIKEGPLRGLGDQVNLMISRRPVPIRLQGPIEEIVARTGGKASSVVNLWDYHQFVQGLVAAHPEFFGGNVEAVAQIPYDLRDQFTWFRFDRVPDLVDAATRGWETGDWVAFAERAASVLGDSPDGATAAGRILNALFPQGRSDPAIGLLFPELSVPIGWHGVGTRDFRVDLSTLREAGVPQSSVVLFHELFGHGGNRENAAVCRASDEYSEGTLEDFLASHPREAALIRFLGQKVSLRSLADEIGGRLPEALRPSLDTLVGRIEGADREVQLVTLLTEAGLVQRVVGKPLGHPNVLPNDPDVIDEVWGAIPGFRKSLWTEDSGRPPREGDVRIVPGGLYFPDRPFVRLQVFAGDRWRDTYMKDSHNPDAPIGPVMERCLERTAATIRRTSGEGTPYTSTMEFHNISSIRK